MESFCETFQSAFHAKSARIVPHCRGQDQDHDHHHHHDPNIASPPAPHRRARILDGCGHVDAATPAAAKQMFPGTNALVLHRLSPGRRGHLRTQESPVTHLQHAVQALRSSSHRQFRAQRAPGRFRQRCPRAQKVHQDAGRAAIMCRRSQLEEGRVATQLCLQSPRRRRCAHQDLAVSSHGLLRGRMSDLPRYFVLTRCAWCEHSSTTHAGASFARMYYFL